MIPDYTMSPRGRRGAYATGSGTPRREGMEEGARGARKGRVAYALRIFWARLRRRIFFLRHFQRCLPGFFQARELRFMDGHVHPGVRGGGQMGSC